MTALDDVLPALGCPVCAAPLANEARAPADARVLGCAAGHRFDVARQGYVNLAVGRAHPGTGDSAAMVDARWSFLAAGHFAPVDDALRDALHDVTGLVVDLAGGTGQHLSGSLPTAARGLVVDLSPAALRRAARLSPDRIAAVGADVWRGLPLRDRTVVAVLSVFGPRNPAEIGRVLAGDGRLVVVSPRPEHLCELRDPLRLLAVDPDKGVRQQKSFASFALVDRRTVTYGMALSRTDCVTVAGMGPAARHVGVEELTARAAGLAQTSTVTASVEVTVFAAS